jgi:hypothetical protein
VDIVVALAALIVAILASRNASRSADASQDSTREAKRSVDAAERQVLAAGAALPGPRRECQAGPHRRLRSSCAADWALSS